MNEAETRAEHIDPALKAAGWGVVDGVSSAPTLGRPFRAPLPSTSRSRGVAPGSPAFHIPFPGRCPGLPLARPLRGYNIRCVTFPTANLGTPLQGFSTFRVHVPGRCPGLRLARPLRGFRVGCVACLVANLRTALLGFRVRCFASLSAKGAS